MGIKSYKDLIVWQKSINLVNEIYIITRQMPKSELFGLMSQMQRAAVAIPSNIAEGFGRKGRKEFVQFLFIAYASSLELDTQLTISKRQYSGIDYQKAEGLLIEVQKMLKALIRTVESNARPTKD